VNFEISLSQNFGPI